MIYIDNPPHTNGWSHLFADSIAELHDFARKFSVKRYRFHNRRGRYQPHYDVRSFRVPAMVAAGAVLVPWRDVPTMFKERYSPTYYPHKHIRIPIGEKAVATFTKIPDKKTLEAVEALVAAVSKMSVEQLTMLKK